MFTKDLNGELTATALVPAAVVTANANGSGVDLIGYIGNLKVVVNVGASTGTSQTLDLKIQDSADNATFADLSPANAITQVAGAGASLQSLSLDTRAVRRYVRAVSTVGGTSPSFPLGVTAVGYKQVE